MERHCMYRIPIVTRSKPIIPVMDIAPGTFHTPLPFYSFAPVWISWIQHDLNFIWIIFPRPAYSLLGLVCRITGESEANFVAWSIRFVSVTSLKFKLSPLPISALASSCSDIAHSWVSSTAPCCWLYARCVGFFLMLTPIKSGPCLFFIHPRCSLSTSW